MAIEIIETHAHIYSSKFDDDREDVIERAKKEGIQKILMPNVDVHSLDALHDCEANHPDFCIAMMGLHPCSVGEDYKEQLTQIKNCLD